MISTPSLDSSCLFAVIMMIALTTVAGTNKVADMQLNFWREKLPSIQVPETVAASMSPLTEEEANTFSKIIKDGNLQFHATQFCKSANLLCRQPVDLVAPILSWSRSGPVRLLKETSGMFFSLKKLRERGQITLPELYSPWKSFLPRNLSELLPFSKKALPDILSSFGIPEKSNMALDMNMTLSASEAKLPKEEIGKCTTSIEGMIEFVLSNFGTSHGVDLISHPGPTADIGKKAVLRNVIERQSDPSHQPPLACHRMVYPYGVFYCHSFSHTMTFTIEMEVLENNGNFYNVTAVCHPHGQGQSEESTNCHLVVGDTLLWLTKENR
eukprot:PITA_08219